MAELADRDPAATIVAIVLAAGFASRMGAFKPPPFGERTLVDHVVTNLRAAGVGRIHVVTGFQADALAPELTRLGLTRAHNPDFAAGRARSAPGAKFGRGPRIAGLTSIASTLLIGVHGVSRAFARVRDDDEDGRRRLLNGCEQA